MKKIALIAVAGLAALAAPASANEGRVEARGGIAWGGGASEAIAGVGAGYDFDAGDNGMFFGVEGGADKVLAGGTKVLWSVGGRVGAKMGDAGRLYGAAGIGFCCGTSDPYVGAGYQHSFGEKTYAKVEYRRVLESGSDSNIAAIGLGVRF